MAAEDETTQPVSSPLGIPRLAKASGDIDAGHGKEAPDPFLGIGSWLPPSPVHASVQKRSQLPQPTDHRQRATTHMGASRSSPDPLAEQPGLIPVDQELEPLRFPSPFTGTPHEVSTVYAHVRTANQHWQPFHADPQPESSTLNSQVDSQVSLGF